MIHDMIWHIFPIFFPAFSHGNSRVFSRTLGLRSPSHRNGPRSISPPRMWCHGGFYRHLKYGISMVEICGNHMKNMGIFRPKSWWYPWGYDDWRWFGSENGVYTMKCGHWIGKIMIDHWFLGYPMLRQTLYTIYIYDNIIGYCLKDFAEATTRMIFARIINNMHFLGMIYTWCTWIAGRILGTK